MYVLYLKVNLISRDEMVFMELGYLCPDGYKEKNCYENNNKGFEFKMMNRLKINFNPKVFSFVSREKIEER